MGTRGHGEDQRPCKGENAAVPPAKVQRWEAEIHFRVSGLGSRESGTGYQVRVRVRVLNLHLYLNT